MYVSSVHRKDGEEVTTKTILPIIAMASLLLLPSCILDPKDPPEKTEPPVTVDYKPLTSEANVMHNLKLSYNQRNIREYENLLQEKVDGKPIEFTFFFAAGDVSNGDTPAQWGYLDEIGATTNMFSSYDPDDPNVDPISDIDLQLFFEGVTWINSFDPTSGETWRKATIVYNYNIIAGVNTYIVGDSNARAEFIVRPVDVDGTTEYRLVSWRDLGTD